MAQKDPLYFPERHYIKRGGQEEMPIKTIYQQSSSYTVGHVVKNATNQTGEEDTELGAGTEAKTWTAER